MPAFELLMKKDWEFLHMQRKDAKSSSMTGIEQVTIIQEAIKPRRTEKKSIVNEMYQEELKNTASSSLL